MLFQRGRALASGSRAGEAERLLTEALEQLGDRTSARGLTAARIRLTLAYVRAERGRVSEGLAALDELEAGRDASLAGLIAGQRGIILMRAGRPEAAAESIDIALRLLGRETPERAQMLLNRGLLRLNQGELEPARRDLTECREVSARLGSPLLVGQAAHNLALVWHLSGDLPQALQQLDRADEVLHEWPDLRFVYHVDRARVLTSAGLVDEADGELALAARMIRRGGRRQDLAETDLHRAQVALLAGRPAQARVLARRASRRFAERGSPGWARLADLADAQALLALDRARALEPSALRAIAADLSRHGLADDARLAVLVLTRALLGSGDLDGARREAAGGLHLRRRDPIATRLAVRGVRALLAEAAGDAGAARSQRRAGLVELHRYQATFGSLDLQTAVAVHGRELAADGLAAALREGGPATVLAWAERSRALASRVAPVRPPQDPEAAAILARLRFARRELRLAQLEGRTDPTLWREATTLERRARHRSWYVQGPGDVDRPVGLAEVRSTLGDSGVMVAHVVSRGSIHALVVTARRARLVPLGAVAPVIERLRRTRSDLDMLAVAGYPARIRSTVAASLRAGLAALDEALWHPLERVAGGGGPLVLVPAGALTAVPWTMLPGLSGRPLTVARSATAWVAQRRGPTSPLPATGSEPVSRSGGPVGGWREVTTVVAAGGPDLPHAEAEVRAVAGLWPGARSLLGPEATGRALLAALRGSTIVHVAAHGTHEVANPMFSSLRLADGPLFGYDLSAAEGMPAHVVLSACDLGRATERPGDELLGMTAALLHAGTGSVLASVARVGDAAAKELTVDYHARLRRGSTPSEALAEATAAAPAPFVCFGSGW